MWTTAAFAVPAGVGPRGVRELPSGYGLPIGLAEFVGGVPPVRRTREAEGEEREGGRLRS
ncbi:hypothetical protein [Streptomyces sp. NPDC001250]|uniref:hypothetical protein n=1 Tax=unclassified Streptomyces TaxID=2593676 RepID=UPI00332E4E86